MRIKKEMFYQSGFIYKSLIDITKKDIITLCKLLNSLEYYKGVCTFEPEAISEGGIVYNFFNNDKVSKCLICSRNGRKCSEIYKSIRFCLGYNGNSDRWPCVSIDVMDDWVNDDDIVISKRSEIHTYLKAFCGAPPFTKEELAVIDDAFATVGLVRMFKTK